MKIVPGLYTENATDCGSKSDLSLKACVASRWAFFFFSSRRRHTRFSRDWSSDVCSSDLQRAIDALLVPAVGQGLERLDVLLRPGRTQELGPEAARLGDDELDRNALDGDADRAPLRPFDDRDDLWKRLEALQQPLRPRG